MRKRVPLAPLNEYFLAAADGRDRARDDAYRHFHISGASSFYRRSRRGL